jgi:hypothetical protein
VTSNGSGRREATWSATSLPRCSSGPPPDAEIDENVPLSAFVCSVPVENGAQPAASSPAPVTQQGDQESEAGEIEQSFEVS